MSSEAMKVLTEMIKEYELLARYNTSKEDYKRYTVLLEICKELQAKTK